MKKHINEWKKYLTESSLSRLWRHIMEHESGIISAFRNDQTRKENMQKNRELKAQLLEKGYGITKVEGSFIENFDTPEAVKVSENSLFVSNRKDDDNFALKLARLGEKYDQDSVLIIPKGGEGAYLFGTSKTNDFPPYGDTFEVGNLKMGEEAEFMTKVGDRPITFAENSLEVFEDLSRNTKWAIKKIVDNLKK